MENTLITNARIFDGKNDKRSENMSVLVEGNKITKVANSATPPSDATVIDAKAKIFMPAYADLLLVDGNPLENLDLVADPSKGFVLIMKDGKIFKNTVEQPIERRN